MLSPVLLAVLLAGVHGLTDSEIARFNTLRFPDLKEQNTNAKTNVNITDNNDGTLTLQTNNIPNHATWIFPQNTAESRNPHSVKVVYNTVTFDKDPQLVEDGKEIYCMPMGAVGYTVSGAVIDAWYAAERGCPYASEFEELDICEGHPSPTNSYHYHHFSPCINAQTCGTPSEIVGVAMDGIPIYGPWDETGKQLTHDDLDTCGGRVDNTGRYKYHVTVDPPYYMGCLKGKLRKQPGEVSMHTMMSYQCHCPYYDVFNIGGGSKPNKTKRAMSGPMTPSVSKDGTIMIGDSVAPICDFSSNETYLQCADNWNKSYIIEKKWVVESKTIDLAPCCIANKTCPVSCIYQDTEAGAKKLHENCTRESREVKYRSRKDKTAEEIKEEQAAIDKINGAGGSPFAVTFILYAGTVFLVLLR